MVEQERSKESIGTSSKEEIMQIIGGVCKKIHKDAIQAEKSLSKKVLQKVTVEREAKERSEIIRGKGDNSSIFQRKIEINFAKPSKFIV